MALEVVCGRTPEILHRRAPTKDVAQPVTRRVRQADRLTELCLVTEELIIQVFEDHECAAAKTRGEGGPLHVALDVGVQRVGWREAEGEVPLGRCLLCTAAPRSPRAWRVPFPRRDCPGQTHQQAWL